MRKTLSDEYLLAQFARGRREAFGLLAERHERALLGLALGMLGDRQAAEDAVQETWERAIRGAAGFEGRSTVKTWLYQICINRCRDLRTAAAARPRPAPGVAAERLAAPERDVEERERLRELVDTLRDEQREALLLCYHDGMTHATAAEILGVPLGTLKSRLHAGLTELRERLATEASR